MTYGHAQPVFSHALKVCSGECGGETRLKGKSVVTTVSVLATSRLALVSLLLVWPKTILYVMLARQTCLLGTWAIGFLDIFSGCLVRSVICQFAVCVGSFNLFGV